MTRTSGPGRIRGKERIARVSLGMPRHHPERVTRRPRRAEWKHLAAWCAQLWPNDEYTAIVADAWRQDHP